MGKIAIQEKSEKSFAEVRTLYNILISFGKLQFDQFQIINDYIILLISTFFVITLYQFGINWEGIKPILGTFSFIFILIVLFVFAWIFGRREQNQHLKNINHIPIRIHVNGIRGKSTVTRLIGGILREADLKTLTKTTGKMARIIDLDGSETPINRKAKPNIREQIDIINLSVEKRIDALVMECMAVQPELQRVSEVKMIRSTIGVITNVRTDHLDVMGPTLEDVAKSLCNSIPKNGIVVTAESKFLHIIQEHARKVKTKVIKVIPEKIDDELLISFSYLNFKENIAIALEVSRLLNIPDDVAIRGMLKTEPDPGLMRIYQPKINGKVFTFVNAFGVNDKDSTTMVYNELERRGHFDHKSVIGVFHARSDRVTRTIEFGNAMVSEMSFKKIIVIGKMTKLFLREALKAKYPEENIIDLGESTANDAVTKMSEISKDITTVFFGCGNMVGDIPLNILEIISEGCKYQEPEIHFRPENIKNHILNVNIS
ncbi:MAG TPA: poly-gamma-glutamate synthase PgsB [Candidatus Methanoperedens sp.]|nr:poly-gamma-glutamate synthase PgsB [Candidatus Methanoperedens sp.]